MHKVGSPLGRRRGLLWEEGNRLGAFWAQVGVSSARGLGHPSEEQEFLFRIYIFVPIYGAHPSHSAAVTPSLFPQIPLPPPKVVFS